MDLHRLIQVHETPGFESNSNFKCLNKYVNNDDHLVQNAVYVLWNWSWIAIIGIGIGFELPSRDFCTGVGIELELLLPELELNCKNWIDPGSD